MLAVALSALRSRLSASLALCLITVLVTVAVVGAPYYLLASLSGIVATDVAAAPAGQRLVELTIGAPVSGVPDDLPHAIDLLDKAVDLPGAVEVRGLRASGTIAGTVEADLAIAARDGVCDRVTVDGACPTGTGDAMISRGLAALMGVHVGGTMPWPGTAANDKKPPTLRIVGIYQPLDPADPYWGSGLLAATIGSGAHNADAIFVTRDTLLADAPVVTAERQLLVTVATVRALGADGLSATLAGTYVPASDYGSQTSFDAEPMISQIQSDTDRLRTSIPLLAAEIVLFGWFALALVLRAVVTARRADVGLLLLRGTSRVRMWWLLTLQSAVPLVVGVPVGALLGWAGARLLAGPVPAADTVPALAVAAGGVLVVLVGSLIAAGVAERRSRRTPIPELLRRTPARRRGWRADVVDVVVLALAVFGLVQARLAGGATATGLAALAPALVALALGLLAGRLLGPVAGRAIAGARRTERTGVLLAAAYLSRRGGLDRLVALLVIAVALAGSAAMAWHVASVAQQRRAAVEVGADQVVDVRDASAARLLDAVRAADPSGRYLMAVTSVVDTASGVPVLAVDSSRLPYVLAPGGWPGGADLARVLRPEAVPTTRVTAGALRLTAVAEALPRSPVTVTFTAVDDRGNPHTADFGPLLAGTGSYTATLPGCTAGCVPASFDVHAAQVPGTAGPHATLGVVLRGLTVVGAGAITPPLPFTDRDAWHTSIGPEVYGPILSAASDGLRVDLIADEQTSGGVSFDSRVFPAGPPLPLPAVLVGHLPAGLLGGVVTVSPLGDLDTPIDIAATVPALPRVTPDGVYVDLESAVEVDAGAGVGARGQVWMRADTPAPVRAALRASGLTLSTETDAATVRAGYRTQATELTLWFSLAGAAIALLIGVVALALVVAAERDGRRAEFAALRRQGVAACTVRRAALYGYGAIVLLACAVGLLAVLAGGLVTGTTQAVFADGWNVLRPPSPGSGIGWPLAACAGVPLLAVAYVAGRRVAREGGAR